MPKHIYSFEVVTKTTYEHEAGAPSSSPVETKMFLKASPNIDLSVYEPEDGIYSIAGTKVISANLLLGIYANIKQAHEQGLWKDYEHMKWVINHLNELFVSHSKVVCGEYGDIKHEHNGIPNE